MRFQRISIVIAVALLGVGCATRPALHADDAATQVASVRQSQLQPDFWIAQAPAPDRVVLDPAAIAGQNRKLRELDTSVHDLERLPATLSGDDIRTWIDELSSRPERTLYDEQGHEIGAQTIDDWMAALDRDAIPATQPTRYGLVVKRADLRTYPTRMRAFSSRGNTDIDRVQENALFPGTPVVIAHASRDGRWWFIVSPLYRAWIEKDAVAEGTKQQVLDYVHRSPYVVVTGATAHTAFTPERPEVSDLQLDMGVRLPVVTDWPQGKAVNGQHPYTSWIVELPYRAEDGSLQFTPALLPKTNDVSSDYLPLTQANVLQQGFKFLGERYGWGSSYNARDCSGFVSEVYRSFGVTLPRNTRDQGVSPAFNRIAFEPGESHEARLAVLRTLQVGDLIYIPGHVMMVIGQYGGMPYIIHDTTGISYRNAAGEIEHDHLNGVSVTPLVPLLLDGGRPLIDRIYAVQKIRH